VDVPPLLAHAGGWDELLVAALVALWFAGRGFLRRRREAPARSRRGAAGPARRGPCAYCGGMLQETDRRCRRCGFRARVEAGP